MIPYKSRAGRAIRNFLGGTVGACAAFLLIVRAEAGEETTKQPEPPAGVKACESQAMQASAPCAKPHRNTEAAK